MGHCSRTDSAGMPCRPPGRHHRLHVNGAGEQGWQAAHRRAQAIDLDSAVVVEQNLPRTAASDAIPDSDSGKPAASLRRSRAGGSTAEPSRSLGAGPTSATRSSSYGSPRSSGLPAPGRSSNSPRSCASRMRRSASDSYQFDCQRTPITFSSGSSGNKATNAGCRAAAQHVARQPGRVLGERVTGLGLDDVPVPAPISFSSGHPTTGKPGEDRNPATSAATRGGGASRSTTPIPPNSLRTPMGSAWSPGTVTMPIAESVLTGPP